MRRLRVTCLVALAACCPEAETSRFSSRPSGIAHDGELVLVASERYDAAEGGSRAQVSLVSLVDSSVITHELPDMHGVQLTSGTTSQLALGTSAFAGSYPWESIEAHELRAILIQGGVPLDRYVTLSPRAIRPRARFDGTAFQVVWFEPVGTSFAVRGRTVGEDGTLGPVVELAPPVGATSGSQLELRAFGPGRTALLVVDQQGLSRSTVRFITAGNVDAEAEPIEEQYPQRYCPFSFVLGAETLSDSTGAPVFRVFVCGVDDATPVVAYEHVPGAATRVVPLRGPVFGDGEVFSFDAVLGAGADRLVVYSELGRHGSMFELFADYRVNVMFSGTRWSSGAGADNPQPQFVRRANEWVTSIYRGPPDPERYKGGLFLERMNGVEQPASVLVTADEGVHRYRTDCGE